LKRHIAKTHLGTKPSITAAIRLALAMAKGAGKDSA
jgi:hypothetical protein